MTPQLTIAEPADRTPAGIKERGRVLVKCADCERPLIELLITRNNEDLAKAGAEAVTSRVKCQCGFCGGQSYVAEVEGTFSLGIPQDDTTMDVLGEEDGVLIFKAGPK